MKILALEFSSPQRSVAFVQRSHSPASVVQYEVVEAGTSSSKPFEMIEEVLSQSGTQREQIERLVIGLGPGSYTGIRASIALAQGWQLGLGTPLNGISSAESIAVQALGEGITGRIAVIIDAQRGEFYLATYELTAGGWREIEPLRLASAASVSEHERRGDLLVGPEVLNWFPNGRTVFPRAAVLGRLALDKPSSTAGENLQPIYLRTTSFVKAPPPRILPQ